MIRLSKSQVLLIHDQLIAETGGSSGLRDEGMLDSCTPGLAAVFLGKVFTVPQVFYSLMFFTDFFIKELSGSRCIP